MPLERRGGTLESDSATYFPMAHAHRTLSDQVLFRSSFKVRPGQAQGWLTRRSKFSKIISHRKKGGGARATIRDPGICTVKSI
ncbi:MAG: hypothetical protein JRJ09_01150 [Deltaproteobacteria bacterium]|nr:hypothetical protein [Deltaproteobacteria bacterium]